MYRIKMGDPGIELKPFWTLTNVDVRTPIIGKSGELSSTVVLFMMIDFVVVVWGRFLQSRRRSEISV